MGKIRIILSVILMLGAVGFLIISILVISSEYSWYESDWNLDGHVSFSELTQSVDIGKRKMAIDGKECVEYYYLKDALTVKVVCNEVQKELSVEQK